MSRSAVTSPMSRKSIVVGGGFVGLASALHLQRVGRQVTIIEASKNIGGAAAASYGNAGTMAAYANVPVNSPSLFRKLPSLVMDPASPLSIKPSAHLASMLPWACVHRVPTRAPCPSHQSKSTGSCVCEVAHFRIPPSQVPLCLELPSSGSGTNGGRAGSAALTSGVWLRCGVGAGGR